MVVDQPSTPITSFIGMRVETCPISGTIERGSDPLEDAEQVKKLLSNKKEESELTMCTDVDRNDKSRICNPGTVKILGKNVTSVMLLTPSSQLRLIRSVVILAPSHNDAMQAGGRSRCTPS